MSLDKAFLLPKREKEPPNIATAIKQNKQIAKLVRGFVIITTDQINAPISNRIVVNLFIRIWI